MRSGRARKLVGIAALCCAVAPAAAHAQEPGVHVDPQSPAGTEYALPLVQARGDNAGQGSGGSHGSGGSGGSAATSGGGSGSRQSGTPVRFGVGIRDGNAGNRRGANHKQLRPERGGAGHGVGGRDIVTAAAHPDSTSAAVAVLAAVVVLAGLGLGLLLRRRSRGT